MKNKLDPKKNYRNHLVGSYSEASILKALFQDFYAQNLELIPDEVELSIEFGKTKASGAPRVNIYAKTRNNMIHS